MTGFVAGSKKYSPTDLRQQTNALLLYIANDLVPFSAVDSAYFKGLLESADPRYQMPCRKTLTSKLLQEKCAEIRSDTIKQLKLAQAVCVTLDIWSSRQMRSYLGITSHCILNWTMQGVMLACKRFKARHTADNIIREYEETIACFGLVSKVTAVITDNASNMVAGFSLPGYEAPQPDDNDIDTDSELIDLDPLDADLDYHETLPAKHIPCFAHTLQLVINDGFKSVPQLNRILNKTAKIVAFVHRSTVATGVLDGEKRLQAANATRWNSQVKMIRSVLAVSENKLRQLDTSATLGIYERNILQDMLEILEPFEEATDHAQAQNIIHPVMSSLVSVA